MVDFHLARFDPRAVIEMEDSRIHHEVAHGLRYVGTIAIVPFVDLELETACGNVADTDHRWVAFIVGGRLHDHDRVSISVGQVHGVPLGRAQLTHRNLAHLTVDGPGSSVRRVRGRRHEKTRQNEKSGGPNRITFHNAPPELVVKRNAHES